MSHDTLGDLASLLGPGQSYRIRRSPQRTWLVSLLDADGACLDYGEADDIEEAAAQLVATMAAIAADCPQCERRATDPGTPRHDGSPDCRSGSIASGDARRIAHCTCDTCY